MPIARPGLSKAFIPLAMMASSSETSAATRTSIGSAAAGPAKPPVDSAATRNKESARPRPLRKLNLCSAGRRDAARKTGIVFAPRDAVTWLHLPRAGPFDGAEILSASSRGRISLSACRPSTVRNFAIPTYATSTFDDNPPGHIGMKLAVVVDRADALQHRPA